MGMFGGIGEFFSNPLNILTGGLAGPIGLGSVLAGGSALSSLIGGKQANDADTRAAQEQQKFQEWMSSSAHQREVVDVFVPLALILFCLVLAVQVLQLLSAVSPILKILITPAINSGLTAFKTGMDAANTMADITLKMNESGREPQIRQNLVNTGELLGHQANSARTQANVNTETELNLREQNSKIQQEISNLKTLELGYKVDNAIKKGDLELVKREVLNTKNQGVDLTQQNSVKLWLLSIVPSCLWPSYSWYPT